MAACRVIALFSGLWLVLCLSACGSNEAETPPQGDADSEAETETSNPCAHINCSPGVCSVLGGVVSCTCPDGTSGKTSCATETDGDESDAPQENSETTEDGDSAGEDVSEPAFDGLPDCTGDSDTAPCRMDIPFTWTNDKGEFRIGYTNSEYLYSLSVWEDWIAFSTRHENKNLTGIFLFNAKNKKGIRLASKEKRLYCCETTALRDSRVAWMEIASNGSSEIYTSSLGKITKTLLTNTETLKDTLRIWGDSTYWVSAADQFSAQVIYALRPNSQVEERVLPNGVSLSEWSFDLYENKVVYESGVQAIGLFDLSTQQNSFLANDYTTRFSPVIWANSVFWTDQSLAAEPMSCGYSAIQYDLQSGTSSYLKRSDGYSDYFPESAWGEWVVYSSGNEGGGPEGSQATCVGSGAQVDLFLRYLPTGEEWNISNHVGSQISARMWDHLIVWRDARETPTSSTVSADLYGIDLCKHPELKSRFASCGAATVKKQTSMISP